MGGGTSLPQSDSRGLWGCLFPSLSEPEDYGWEVQESLRGSFNVSETPSGPRMSFSVHDLPGDVSFMAACGLLE